MNVRAAREAELRLRYGDGDRGRDVLDVVVQGLEWVIRLAGLRDRGIRNALDIKLKRKVVEFENLPRDFEGYSLLHITDMHFGSLPGIEESILRTVWGVEADLCVFTGDYRSQFGGDIEHVISPMRALVAAIDAKDGFLATLGNHDSVRMVEPFERLGLRVLGNETVKIERGATAIHLTGIDDVEAYYTEMAGRALAGAPDGFKIVLAHSPGMAAAAASAGFDLYLCGHTHGGQVALPGGVLIATRMRGNRRLAAGTWRVERMVGMTSNGAGVSILPIRFNAEPEVTLLTLRSGMGSVGVLEPASPSQDN